MRERTWRKAFMLLLREPGNRLWILDQLRDQGLIRIDPYNGSVTEVESPRVTAQDIVQQPQVQYNLTRQLAELRLAAWRLGLYDADTFLSRLDIDNLEDITE